MTFVASCTQYCHLRQHLSPAVGRDVRSLYLLNVLSNYEGSASFASLCTDCVGTHLSWWLTSAAVLLLNEQKTVILLAFESSALWGESNRRSFIRLTTHFFLRFLCVTVLPLCWYVLGKDWEDLAQLTKDLIVVLFLCGSDKLESNSDSCGVRRTQLTSHVSRPFAIYSSTSVSFREIQLTRSLSVLLTRSLSVLLTCGWDTHP